MSEIISFPGLGLEFEVNRVAFTLPAFLGSRPIYWYGVLVALGLLAGLFYFLKRTKEFGINAERSMDVLLVSILTAVIGARLYYVLFSWDMYKDDPLRIFNVTEGGIAIYGAVIGAFAGAALMCKLRKVKYLPTMDLAAGSLLLGQAIGRWGNFINMEAFGSNTNAPWGMTSPTISAYLREFKGTLSGIGVAVDPSMPVHPTFFYESIWCLAGFFFILFFTKRRRFDGQLTLIYLGWYGLGRFFIEGLRTDSLMLGAMRISQILAFLCFVVSTLTLFLILSKIKREGDDEYLKLFVLTDESQLVVSGEYYKKPERKKDSDGDTPGGEETVETVEVVEVAETVKVVETIETEETSETVEAAADEPAAEESAGDEENPEESVRDGDDMEVKPDGNDN